ncbi:hypothetical protein [Serinicoccus kebangsaanensis]|uniref:hypothetical protein n=1 Tax=Serinicoccus kebangsaanensis TaxID=2602069 RepID=UPI00124DEBA0|nr:hypothetical protein [Serinicoccus kebangsaanensis]
MSDQADRETIGDDLGVWSVDAEDQLQPEDTLDGEGDVLDRGYSSGEHYWGSSAFGVTADEQSRVESIAQRERQEESPRYAERHRPDHEARDIARECHTTSWDSPEESAMHYHDPDSSREELTEVEWQPSDEEPRSEDE